MELSRRSFLLKGATLPAISWSRLGDHTSSSQHSSLDPWVEVHAGHLRHNVHEISKRVQRVPILAVIKNNGYGLGVENVARVLEPIEAIHGFAVVKLQEAIVLRNAGVRKPILLLGAFGLRDLDEILHNDIMPMVYTPIGAELERRARETKKAISFHVCVDTGIGRVGVPYRMAESLIGDLATRPGLKMQGIMMTFTEDKEFDQEQLLRFHSLCTTLKARGIDYGLRHAASSYTLFQHSNATLDMVRPGMVLYGVYPEQEFRTTGAMHLRPAVSLKCRVAYVKQLHAGESAGYNKVYKAMASVWIATLPTGHADGLPRVVSKGARVRIGQKLYPIVAISASHTIVELGTEKTAREGDLATFFDWTEGSRPEDVAQFCGASVYDLTMHLNPLLPRMMVD